MIDQRLLRENPELVRASQQLPAVSREHPAGGALEAPGGLFQAPALRLQVARAPADEGREPGAAEADEREVARVVALFDRDQAQGAEHGFVDDLANTLGGRHQVDAHGICNFLHSCH